MPGPSSRRGGRAAPPFDVVFLLRVDNTLLDNDALVRDLRRYVEEAFGSECQRRYWQILEQLRAELGYADYTSVPCSDIASSTGAIGTYHAGVPK